MTSAGIDWQREKWQSGLGSKFIHQGEKNAAKYADEVIVLSKGVQDYFKETYGRETHFIPNGVNSHIDSMSYLPLLTAKKAGVPVRIAHSHNTSIHFVPSQFAKVAKTNGQLKAPSVMPMERNNILDINRRNGYEGVERYFSRKYRYQILLYTGYDLIPQKVRKRLKKILKR